VPEVYGYETNPDLIGRAFMIMQFIPGNTLLISLPGLLVRWTWNIEGFGGCETCMDACHFVIPVPEVYGYETNPDLIGRAFMIMQFIPGNTGTDFTSFRSKDIPARGG
jgi:aminoglycoside phosphotransferase (APT) family kinase protein